MSAVDSESLRRQIEAHRISNGLDTSDGWWDRVQDEICGQPGVRCEKASPSLYLSSVLSFVGAMTTWFAQHKFRKASRATIAARRAICAKCPMKVNAGVCGACHQALETVTTLVSGDTPPNLGACGVCQCHIGLKTMLPDATIKATTESSYPHPWPDQCWVKPLL